MGEEAQRVCKPLGCARRCQAEGLFAGFAQHGDRVGVALAGRALHVMGARGRGGAARREQLRAALVRPQPPTTGRGLVHRAPDKRVPEPEAPGHIGLTDEIELQQLVDRVHRVRFRRVCPRRRQLGLERVTGHRSSFQHTACAVREERELLV